MKNNSLKEYSGNHAEQTDTQKRLLQNLYERIVPRSYAGIGAVLGAVTITELFIIWYMIYLPTGWSTAVYLLAVPAVLLTTYLIIITAASAVSIIKKYSSPVFNTLAGTFIAFILVTSFILGLSIFWAVIFAFLLIPLPALLGAAVGNILQTDLISAKPLKRIFSVAILILTLGANILLAVWLSANLLKFLSP